MNFAYFIARRMAVKSQRTFSKLIVRIAIAGVMLSLAVMILSVSVIKGFKTEIREKVRGYIGDIQIFKYDMNGSYENSPFLPDDSTLQYLRSNNRIDYFQYFATKPAIISANNEIEGINFKGVGKDYRFDFIKKHLVSGRCIDFRDSIKANREIMISSFTANRLKLKAGDEFIIYFVQDPPRRRKFEIVGIYNVGIENIDKGFVLGSISLVQRLNNWLPGQVGGIEIRLKDFAQLAPVSDRVYERIDKNLRSYPLSRVYPGIFNWLDLLDVNTKVLLVLMMIVGVINMITALLIMILERANMIGLLKSMGATDYTIMKIFLYNAAYLVLIGLVLGNILGLGLAFIQLQTQFFQLNQTSYFLNYVPVEVHFTDVLLLNLATVVISLIVLIVPAMYVSRVSPLKAIRFK
ncbi:ABC transporter permease [Pedobacter yulinensis]|uniref:ABC transporter permease n=1 Tax=Pedobacter yulinensis TaxID=2126353 RepID=A0A2T3HHK0_9SPHI|nr:FtsX-like permease family protein [Pedobacter yulinensis]PST81910.1 ABC transporter permease [Pedobacter yulinensis]